MVREHLEAYLGALLDAYARCDGDADAMVDLLLAEHWRDLSEKFNAVRPVLVDGDLIVPARLFREMVATRAMQTVEMMGHGQARH